MLPITSSPTIEDEEGEEMVEEDEDEVKVDCGAKVAVDDIVGDA